MQATQKLPEPSHSSHNFFDPSIQGSREEENRTLNSGSILGDVFSAAIAAAFPEIETSAPDIPNGI